MEKTAGVLRSVVSALERCVREGLSTSDGAVSARVGPPSLAREAPAEILIHVHALTMDEEGPAGRPAATRLPGADGAEGEFVFTRPPIKIALGVLLVPRAADPISELDLMERLLMALHEQPRLRLGDARDLEVSVTPDSRWSPEKSGALFAAHRCAPGLVAPYLIRVELRSSRIIRRAPSTRLLEARVRSQAGPVRR